MRQRQGELSLLPTNRSCDHNSSQREGSDDITYCQPKRKDMFLSLHRGALLCWVNMTARHRHRPQNSLIPVGLQTPKVRTRPGQTRTDAFASLVTLTMLSGKPGRQHCRILRRTWTSVFLRRNWDTSLVGSTELSIFLRPRTRRLKTNHRCSSQRVRISREASTHQSSAAVKAEVLRGQ